MPTLTSRNKSASQKHFPKRKKPRIGITIGCPGGIGPEVIAKALQAVPFKNRITLIGHPAFFAAYRLKIPKSVSFALADEHLPPKITPGRISLANARWAYAALQTAVRLRRTNEIDTLVTAPLSKEEINLIDPKFIGHTEYLAKHFAVKKVDMMFAAKKLKTVIVTRHNAIKDLPKLLTKRRLQDTLQLTHQALRAYFKIRRPKIAVCGFNPHAGEDGLIGKEEQTVIRPVIARLRRKGLHLEGPFAADTLFTEKNRKAFDCIVAMYHDQGLIPMKTLYFEEVVNLTIGLPFVRTSPAHGTAYPLAGKNKADARSMLAAIKLAEHLASR